MKRTDIHRRFVTLTGGHPRIFWMCHGQSVTLAAALVCAFAERDRRAMWKKARAMQVAAFSAVGLKAPKLNRVSHMMAMVAVANSHAGAAQ